MISGLAPHHGRGGVRGVILGALMEDAAVVAHFWRALAAQPLAVFEELLVARGKALAPLQFVLMPGTKERADICRCGVRACLDPPRRKSPTPQGYNLGSEPLLLRAIQTEIRTPATAVGHAHCNHYNHYNLSWPRAFNCKYRN